VNLLLVTECALFGMKRGWRGEGDYPGVGDVQEMCRRGVAGGRLQEMRRRGGGLPWTSSLMFTLR
jgi:hypothetical protein